mmetsp:Transcript_21616/g.56377  ORF Transcript_21616/g.56377 Transcript_21616/m.56377 type:complete len:321 (-) Transcript_21616:1096-2058(-)
MRMGWGQGDLITGMPPQEHAWAAHLAARDHLRDLKGDAAAAAPAVDTVLVFGSSRQSGACGVPTADEPKRFPQHVLRAGRLRHQCRVRRVAGGERKGHPRPAAPIGRQRQRTDGVALVHQALRAVGGSAEAPDGVASPGVGVRRQRNSNACSTLQPHARPSEPVVGGAGAGPSALPRPHLHSQRAATRCDGSSRSRARRAACGGDRQRLGEARARRGRGPHTHCPGRLRRRRTVLCSTPRRNCVRRAPRARDFCPTRALRLCCGRVLCAGRACGHHRRAAIRVPRDHAGCGATLLPSGGAPAGDRWDGVWQVQRAAPASH